MDYYSSQPPKQPAAKKWAIIFTIIASVLLVALVGGYYGAMVLRNEAARMKGTNNLMQIALAQHNYESTYLELPTPYFSDRPHPDPLVGIPIELSKRMSWRVTLLPFVEAGTLFYDFHRDEPWDSPSNEPMSRLMYRVYVDPLDAPAPETRYRCFYDNGALFDSDPKARVGAKDIKDGAANTIMYVESADTVTWTQFNDFSFDPAGPLPALGHPKRSVFLAAMADGSVKAVRKTIDPEVLKRCITRDDGAGSAADLDR